MSIILYNSGKIKSYENLKALCKYVGETEEFADVLWQNMLLDEEILEEFNYYVVNHTIKGEIRCGELSLLDIYFNQMCKYNYFHDMAKNPLNCDKDRMVLHAFKQIIEMRKDPNFMEKYMESERNSTDMM